jgi:hypothetical protein
MSPDELSEGVPVSSARSGDQCFFRFSDLAVHHGSVSCTGGLFELSLCRNEIYDAKEARTIRSTLYEIEENRVSMQIRFAQPFGRCRAEQKNGARQPSPLPIFLNLSSYGFS